MKIPLLIIFLVSCNFIFAQKNSALDELRSSYETFEYNQVISGADNLLKNKDSLRTDDLLEVLMMKAVAQYALSDEAGVRKSFIQMLQADRTYELDSEKVSPKIIKLFSEVKTDYLQSVPEKEKNEIVTEPVKKFPDYKEISLRYKEEKESIARSFIFPGWGHLYAGNTLKGSIISTAAAVNIGSLLYFIIDTNKKQKSYLGERDPEIIREKYSSYNNSYKVRNVLIGSLISLYVYTQFDILLFNNPSNYSSDNSTEIQLNWSIPF